MKKWIIVLLIGLLMLGAGISLFYLKEEENSFFKQTERIFLSPFLKNIIINPFSVVGYEYKVLSQTGNESVYDIKFRDIEPTKTEICIISNADIKEITESTLEGEIEVTKSFNYTIPDKLSLYLSDKLIKQPDLDVSLEKADLESRELDKFEKGDLLKFCYIADKTKDFYLKFGDNSIIIILEEKVASQSILVDVIAETGQANFTHLNISATAPYDSLVAYYPFDGDRENTKLTTHYDWTKYNKDGTGVADAVINNTNCVYGDCAKFDDTGDYIGIGDIDSVENVPGLAVSVWVKPAFAAGTAEIVIVRNTDGAGNNVFYMSRTSTERYYFGVENITNSVGERTSNIYQDTNWHHIVGVYNGTHVQVFVDGVADLAAAALTGNTDTSTSGYRIGESFNGTIDEVMIFNISLTNVQILEIYRNQSARFKTTGTQELSNQTYLNISSGNNRVNVSTIFDKLLGSSVNLSVGYYNATGWFYTPPQILTSNTNITFNISDVSTNLTLNYTLIAGNSTNPFYSPIIYGGITYEIWNEGGVADTEYPQFSNIAISIANNTEYPQINYQFNVTITSTNSTAGIEFNGANYTLSNISSSTIFNYTFSSLNGGTYAYHFWAKGNGTSHNSNATIIYYYTVKQNNSYVITLTNSTTLSVEYPIQTTMTGAGCPSQIVCNLSNNVSGFLVNPHTAILGVSNYNYTYNTSGNTNYSAKASSLILTITKNTTDCGISFNETSLLEYPNTFGVFTNCTSDYTLRRNGTIINNSSTQSLGVGTWNFTVTRNDTINYSNILSNKTFTINQNNSYILDLTATTPIEYPTLTDFSGSGCPAQLSCSLNITNGIFQVGVTNANYSTNGNTNYTSNSAIFAVTINQNTSYVLGISGTSPITYGTTTNVAGSGCPSQLSCSLNKANQVYGVSLSPVMFNYSTNGNTNYTPNSANLSITINKDNSIVYMFLNNSRSNLIILNGTIININATRQTGESTITIYRDGNIFNSGISPLFNSTNFTTAEIIHNFTAFHSATENYTASFESFFLNVTSEVIPDTNPPTFTNLRNFTHTVNTSFSQSITATDVSGIDSYWLNDTSYFTINASTGLIINSTNLSRIEVHWLNISVNDTLGNLNSGIFFIDITAAPVAPNVTTISVTTCRYKKFGYFNKNLPFFKEVNCI